MIIKQLKIIEGMCEVKDQFSYQINLIHSPKNSKGKSTYLRLLFYALGYKIPKMKGLNYSDICTEIVVVEKDKEYTINRQGESLLVNYKQNTITFTLPSDHLAFLTYVFGYENVKVLKNLLGIMYIDQEKGWTLLNRGTVIGKIKFSIEELLSGLNNIDIDKLLEKKNMLQTDKDKYAALLNIHDLSQQVYEHNGEIFISDLEKEYIEKIAYLNLKIENIKKSLKELNDVILKEKQFYDYIDSMCLLVKKEDIVIPVNKETIVNLTANYEYLNARRSILVTDIEKLKRERATYEMKLHDYETKNMQMSLFDEESKDVVINKQLANINVDQKVVEELLDKTKGELKDVKSVIKSKIKAKSPYISQIYKYVVEYATSLGVVDKMDNKEDYIFTSDLKSMSGAVLQKMVFAFKIAFLKVIEQNMDTKLFMVLDSPKGKELDDENTKLIEELIHKELCDNQIFIASIYEFECDKRIEIKDRAVENRTM